MNPDLRATFDWLQVQGLPPLPVAPAQDPTRYPDRDCNGSLAEIVTGKFEVGVEMLPVEKFKALTREVISTMPLAGKPSV